MLLPRCTHRQLRYILPRKFHGSLQAESNTAKSKIHASPLRSQLKSKGRKSKKLRAGKRKAFAEDHFPKLSSSLRILHDARGNAPHFPSSLLYSRRLDGVIQPRASSDPFLQDVAPASPQRPIATLEHGLERVLFSPGVQWLQDPRSQVYGFTTWLEKIIPVKNFAFERLPSFQPSSRDQDLYTLAQREGRKYAGSTSSMSGLLSQLYYLISGDKAIDASNLSQGFTNQPKKFTPGQRKPTSVILHYRDGVYLIDSAGDPVPGLSGKNILTWMGVLLEKFLTHSPKEFLSLMRLADTPADLTNEPKREAYRYAKSDKFILRSQLDCCDPRLPGTGVFDIKTRAVLTIRNDQLNFEQGSGYQIRTLQGLVESFEKEYYDLIRSAFLKYSFQARIGNMDGVFVAYHNTKRIFGFQYIPLSEMDARLFGESAAGDAVFEKCLLLLEVVLEEATRELPRQSIRITAEKSEGKDNLRVFIEPAYPDEGNDQSTSIIQLDVSTKSYVREKPTSGPSAVERSKLPWAVLWSVSKSALDPLVIRDNLAAAHKRAFSPLFLPKGVKWEEMEEFWNGLQFNPAAPVDIPFKFELFRAPPTSVQVLRELARRGRNHLERTICKQEGRPKPVLGLPNDAQDVAPLLALAHGPGLVPSVNSSGSAAVDNESQGHENVQESDVGATNAVYEIQETAQKAMASSTMEPHNTARSIVADASQQPSSVTDQTTGAHIVPLAIPSTPGTNADGDKDFIPKIAIIHLEERLLEDQRIIVEGQDRPAEQTSRALQGRSRPAPTRPWATEHSKSQKMINHLMGKLREADRIDEANPEAQEEQKEQAHTTATST